MKVCVECKQQKLLDQFGINKAKKDGLNIRCKPCKNEIQKLKREAKKPPIQKIPENMKKCYTCKKIKNFDSFNVCSNNKDGYNSNCKDCKNEKQRKLHKSKILEVTVKNKVCCICKKEKSSDEFNTHKGSKDGLRSQCRSCQSEYRKEFHSIEENKQRSSELNAKYCKENREKINKRKKESIQTNIQFSISQNLARYTRKVLKNSTDDNYDPILGCTPSFFRKWLKFQFDSEMNYSNYGSGSKTDKKWHIDHIVGYTHFDLTNEDQKLMCTHWTNIQPMWNLNNQEKTNQLQLHHLMNSIVNVHRFIQHTKQNTSGYKILKQKLMHINNLKR